VAAFAFLSAMGCAAMQCCEMRCGTGAAQISRGRGGYVVVVLVAGRLRERAGDAFQGWVTEVVL
jgi:hypothetical protein